MRDSHHSMGLMFHAVLAQQLATCEAFDEVFRKHGLPRAEIDLPTAPASNLPTPSTVGEAEASEHAEIDLPTALASSLSTPSTVAEADASEHADIWRGCRPREFSGLLQAHSFGPA